MTDSQSKDIVLIFTQCKPDVAAKEFNNWLDRRYEELSTIPHILSARRFKATDDEEPEWLGICDVAAPDFIQSSSATQLSDIVHEIDNTVLPHLPIHQHYVYTIIREYTKKPTALPTRYILIAGWSIPAHLEDEFNKWYDEEHMGEVAKVPGFVRGRRYKLLENRGASSGSGPFPYNHLIVFEWEDDGYWGHIIQGERTSWTKKMIAESDGLVARRFELYRPVGVE